MVTFVLRLVPVYCCCPYVLPAELLRDVVAFPLCFRKDDNAAVCRVCIEDCGGVLGLVAVPAAAAAATGWGLHVHRQWRTDINGRMQTNQLVCRPTWRS